MLRAGLGPWNQLMNEGQRMQVLNELGRYDEVLDEAERLRDQMRSLPTEDQDGMVEPWNVKEVILGAGFAAAMLSKKWDQALDFNAEVREVGKARGAAELELALAAYNDYGPLLELGRYDEAEDLLQGCQEVFERKNSIEGLSLAFTALFELEDHRSHLPQALEYGEKALRYDYTRADPSAIARDHHNLALYLHKAGSRSAPAHRLASAIIVYQMGSGRLASSLGGLAWDLNEFGSDALPGSFDEVCNEVEKVRGVRFRNLFERLPKRAKDGGEAMDAVMSMLVEMLESQSEDQPSDQGPVEK